MTRIAALCCALLALLALPLAAAADDLDERQLELNDAAIDAMIAGDHARAVELLEQSIAMGELNITWLNLGRAYAKAGRCNDALTAYDRMAVAPRVDEPSSEELYEILNGYRDELLVDCPGKVIVRCVPAEMRIVVDDGPEQACPAEPLELAAGPHSVRAVHQGQIVQERVVDVQGLSTSHLELVAPVAAPAGLTGGGSDPASELLFGFGVGSASLGGALLLTFLVLDLAVITPAVDEFPELVVEATRGERSFEEVSEERDRIETLQTTNTALLGVGVGLLAVGAGLLLADALIDGSETGSADALPVAPQLVIAPDGDGGFLQLDLRF